MSQVAVYYGLKVNGRGVCLCPFHQDTHPSLKIYPNEKGFYCFTCGVGGDQINFVARYKNLNNKEAAIELAEAFGIPVNIPASYREKREAALARSKWKEVSRYTKWAETQLKMYWILLCEAHREPAHPHFTEAVRNLTYVEYLLECLQKCPQDVYQDRKAVKEIGKVADRITRWFDVT